MNSIEIAKKILDGEKMFKHGNKFLCGNIINLLYYNRHTLLVNWQSILIKNNTIHNL